MTKATEKIVVEAYKETKKELNGLKLDYGTLKKLNTFLEESVGQQEELIILLKNQLHAQGKKPKVGAKPTLDWNRKMEFIKRQSPHFTYEVLADEINNFFERCCKNKFKGAESLYSESKGNGGKLVLLPVVKDGN